MAPIIELRELTKRFGAVTAVDRVDLTIEEGEVFGLLGPNGAGKTTTIQMLTTILRPTSGSATVAGHDVLKDPAAVRRSVGIVFQEPSIDTILTGRENLDLHGRLYGMARRERKAAIDEMLALVGLTERADSLARTYSGGMKRRLEIARGLLHRPRVLFLDEPTLGLDVQTRENIWEHIRRLKRDFGTTVVLTTHYMQEADELADRIGIIDHGRIVALGTSRELKSVVGGDRVRVKLDEPTTAPFDDLDFVEAAEVVDGHVVLRVHDAPRNLAAIVRAAGEVLELDVRAPTLEDVFVHYTGHGIRDDAVKGEGYADTYFRHQTQGGSS